MALIDLKLLGELALEGESQKFTLTSQSYNSDSLKHPFPDGLFVVMFKMAVQADNLFTHLKKFHQVCTDFAADNIHPYADNYRTFCLEHRHDEDEKDTPYDPIEELHLCFANGTISDLPDDIKQYSELLEMAESFGKVKAKMREGFKKFFGGAKMGYMFAGEDGQPVVIPESELPEDVLTKIKTDQERKDINVEYCLDGYNEFYAKCMELIDFHKVFDDYKGCATEILKLFAPYHSELTNPYPFA